MITKSAKATAIKQYFFMADDLWVTKLTALIE
jgi:hypothetical protein